MPKPPTPGKWETSIGFWTGDDMQYGCVWSHWGITYHRHGKCYTVYLLRSERTHVADFDSLRHARQYGEAIDGMTDWTRPETELVEDHGLRLALNRAALKITGKHSERPGLRVVC